MEKIGNIDQIPDNAEYSLKMSITDEMLGAFGNLSGDYNPLHINDAYAIERGFERKVAYGNILGLLISQLVGMHLWAQDVMLLSQRISYNKPVYPGDIIKLTAKVSQKSEALHVIELSLLFSNQAGTTVATGKCQVRSN